MIAINHVFSTVPNCVTLVYNSGKLHEDAYKPDQDELGLCCHLSCELSDRVTIREQPIIFLRP